MPLPTRHRGFHEKIAAGRGIRTALETLAAKCLIQDSDLEYDPQDHPALPRPRQQRHANVVDGGGLIVLSAVSPLFLGAKLLRIW